MNTQLFRSTVETWVRWRTRRLSETPLARVADGVRVRVAGRLDLGQHPLKAPISGRSCVGWSVEVQRWPGWETTAVEHQTRDFVLRDGSGRTAFVRAAGARIVFQTDASWWPRHPTERMLGFLRRHELRELESHRFAEAALEPGDTITVVGVAQLEIDPSAASGSYREPPLRVVFGATPSRPLWILDGAAPLAR